MERFIRTVENFVNRSPDSELNRLAITKIPCGVFLPHTKYIDIVKSMVSSGELNIKFVTAVNIDPLKNALDVPVYSLDELARLNDLPQEMIMLHSRGMIVPEAFGEYFARLNMHPTIIASPDSVDVKTKFFISNLSRLYNTYSKFKQEDSRKAFCGSLLAWATEQIDEYHFAPEPQYMLRGFMPSVGDIAIDGGAFNGETAGDFVALGAKVYSFEMNAENFKECRIMAQKYNFTVENYGLWSKQETLNYKKSGSGSMVAENGDSSAKFIDLDSYLAEHNLPRLDYIKLDIEGAEMEALKGAANSIRKWKPKMAICVYHKMDDFWTIPEYILSLRSDYEFEFRHYPLGLFAEKEDMDILRKYNIGNVPMYWEMILYCR